MQSASARLLTLLSSLVLWICLFSAQTLAVTPQVAAGSNHSVALHADGSLFAWGDNDFGQLGNGQGGNGQISALPVRVTGLSDIVALAVRFNHNLALRADGSVWAWGQNSSGQLGDGSQTDRYLPVRVGGLNGVAAIATGASHSFAVRSDGSLWVWGENSGGNFGNGTPGWGEISNTPIQVLGMEGVVSAAAGYSQSFAIKSDGTLWAWGANGEGKLGLGTFTETETLPVQVRSLNDVTEIWAYADHIMARTEVDQTGQLWAWGSDNSSGQFGDGTTNPNPSPVAVLPVRDFSNFAIGWSHSLALADDQTIWSWGNNTYGQLGIGESDYQLEPVMIDTLASVGVVAVGDFHSLAMTSDGQVWSFGTGSQGELGRGEDLLNHAEPVPVLNAEGTGYLNLLEMAATEARLIVTVSGAGQIQDDLGAITDCTVTCEALYPLGQDVRLTATPETGWEFVGWGGACTGTADCTLTVDNPLSVTANFTQTTAPTYSLSISTSGNGTITSEPAGIDCGSDCSETYDSSTAVTLTATPDTDWQFVAWNGVCAGAGATCTLTLDADQSVMATFELSEQRLSVSTSGQGTVTTDPAGIDCGTTCTAIYASGTAVTLTATPADGWRFTGWGGACTGTTDCLLIIDGPLEVTANFTETTNPYQLDSPVNASFESGIGIAYGWVCNATQVAVQIDTDATIQAAYGAERPDSQSICGDTANGFAAVINWNNYGDGAHSLKLLADGQELTQAQITVTTLGEEFLRDASTSTTVADFPATGLTTTLAWSEPHQNFVVTNPTAARTAAAFAGPGNWESPQAGSFESGRSLIRGWACEASRITATLDGEILTIPYGSAREDTQSLCGDINNGYALAINWNDQGDGSHQMALSIDGSDVETRHFQIATPGGLGTVTGVQSRHEVSDFPNPGDSLSLQWSEPHQNYRIISYTPSIEPEPELPVVIVPLGRTDDQIEITGTAESTTRYLDFGGNDSFTLRADLAGPVKLVDRQATRIILPVGLTIQGAEFVADGVRFTINGHAATLLGNLSDFIFVFAGDVADPDAGVSRSFAEMAADFGASIPTPGEAPVSGTNLGTIQSNGSIAP